MCFKKGRRMILFLYGYEIFMMKCYLVIYFVYLVIEKYVFVFVVGRYVIFDNKKI